MVWLGLGTTNIWLLLANKTIWLDLGTKNTHFVNTTKILGRERKSVGKMLVSAGKHHGLG